MNTSKPSRRENPLTKKQITGKAQVQQESPHKQKNRQHRASRKGNQKDHTTESLRTPTTEVHPTKTGRKSLECKNKQKESPKIGRRRKNPQSKGMENSPVKELNEMETSKLSDIEFKRMVMRILKELTDNYKELSGNYNSMKKETETINQNQKK